MSEELFREGDPSCRTCARAAEQRNPVVTIARGVIAQPGRVGSKTNRAVALRWQLRNESLAKPSLVEAAAYVYALFA
jgi:hypothetical protein